MTRRELIVSGATLPILGAQTSAEPERWIKSVCRYCGVGCGLYIGVNKGRVTAVKGDSDNHNAGFLCVKGALLPPILYSRDRLLYPLIRSKGRLLRATWNEALDLVAGRFTEAAKQHGPNSVAFYGSGQALTEETWVASKLFRAGLRTNNVDGNPRLCMASAAVGYNSTYGKDEPMGCYEDMDYADVFFLIGTNMAEAHPVLWQRVMRRRETDPSVRIIVVDPRRTATTERADLTLLMKPGMDLTILNAMAAVMIREGMADEEFIGKHVIFGEGAAVNKSWNDYQRWIAAYTPERAAAESGCTAEDIVKAARWFGQKGRRAMSMWTMGINQRTQGVWANNLIHNLHLITGKIGIPGSTPFSLTGQPNACGGVRDGGGLAHLLPYGRLVANEKHRAEMESLWGVPAGTIPPAPGLSAIELFQAAEAGNLKALYVMNTNPGHSLPNLNRYRKRIGRGGCFLAVAETYHPTRTSELADVVLPAALWAEKEGVYGNAERRYQLLSQAVQPPGEARPDLAILCDLGRRMGFAHLVPFTSSADVWQEILRASHGTAYDFTGMTRDRLREAHGLLWPLPAAGHPGTKRRYVRGDDPLVAASHPERIRFYGRPDNKAVVWIRDQKSPAEEPDAEFPMYFNTGRILEHWHTGTMTGKVPELRHTRIEAVAEMHPEDMKRLGISDGDKVRVVSRRGSVVFRVKLEELARKGGVYVHMHDPERLCNQITIDAVDPVSKEPEFKICAVRVEKV